MAITRENIAHFYEKYKENLKTEESVIEQFTKADTKENWVANLKKKYRSMRQLYIENEALLNLYIRPFTEGRMELNDELADEFLKQIRDASAQGYEDSLSMLELAEVLEQYFLKHGKRDNYIWTINLLGGIHNAMPDRQDGEKAAWYFQKIRSFKDCYFEIENDDVSSFWEKSAALTVSVRGNTNPWYSLKSSLQHLFKHRFYSFQNPRRIFPLPNLILTRRTRYEGNNL